MWRVFWGRKRERELEEELQSHIEIEAMRLQEDEGLSSEEAHAQARRAFGSRALAAERTRDTWGARWVHGLWQDLEYALRSARRAPGFTAAVVVSLALGIAASTVVFSVADTVYLRPLPYRVPDQLMFVAMRMFGLEMVTSPDYIAWRKDHSVFSELAAMQFHGGNPASLGETDPVEVLTTRVSYNFLATLGIAPALGRDFRPGDEDPNAAKTAIISDAVWRNQFGGRADIVGKSVVLNGAPHEVIGVLPRSFVMPLQTGTDVLLALPVPPSLGHHDPGMATWTVIGRLQPGVAPEQALARLRTLFAASTADAPEIFRNDVSVMIEPLQRRMAGNARALILALAGAVACLLLIACTNVANLLTTRWSARSRELSVRAAIGAGRARLVRQLLTESAVWCAAGAVAGTALVAAGLRTLTRFAAGSVPRLNELTMDARVFAIAMSLSAATMLLFGVVPALRAGRVDLLAAIHNASRPGMTGADRRSRRVLVATEVALSVVLLWGAALLAQTLWRMQHDRLGFAPEHVMTASIPLRGVKADKAARKAMTQELLAYVRTLPGVAAASWAECTPLSGGSTGTVFSRSDRPLPKPWDRADTVAGCAVGPDYFQAAGMLLKRGRAFTDADYDQPQTVAVINEALARRYFPGEDPIGRRIDGRANGGWKTVVGIVADTKNHGLSQAPVPQMFINDVALYAGSDMALVVRYAGPESLVAEAMRSKIREINPGLVVKFETLRQAVGRMSAGPRFNSVLVGSFAAVAFTMALIGLYGVLAMAVSQRTQEIGIRIALGAGPRKVEAMVLREGAALAGIGAAAGVALSIVAGKYVRSLLYSVDAFDATTYVAVIAAVVGAAFVAAWAPARRAARLDPTIALRHL